MSMPRRRPISGTQKIAYSLDRIAYSLDVLVGYARSQEDRQQFIADFLKGLTPMLQEYVQRTFGPQHPVPSRFLHNPLRPRRKRTPLKYSRIRAKQ